MKENIIIVTLCGLFAAAIVALGLNYAAALDDFNDNGRTAVMQSPAVTATTKPPVVAAEATEVKPEPAKATADLMDCRLFSDDKEVLFNTTLSSDREGTLWFGSDEVPFGDYIVSVNGGGKNCPTTVTFPLERGTYVIDGYKVVVK